MACLFCEIAAGRREASIVHADPVCVAFMDIHPVSDGHVLVVPRRHAALLGELEPAERAHVLEVATAIRQALPGAGLVAEGANLLLNDGAAANQHVPHLHVHVIPRQRGDSLGVAWRFASRMFDVFGRARKRARLEARAARIREALGSADG